MARCCFAIALEDFEPIAHRDGTTTGWPFAYDELEPWYTRAEKLYQGPRRSRTSTAPSRRTRSLILSAPCPDEPAIAKVRERMTSVGLNPFPLPLGVDIEKWLAAREDAVGRVSRHWMRQDGRRESAASPKPCAHPNVELRTSAQVERLLVEPDGKRIAGVEVVGRR